MRSKRIYNQTFFVTDLNVLCGDALLVFQGHNLNRASDVDEFSVWIGNSSCRVNSVDSSTLYCSPPVSQPFGLSTSGQLDSDVLPLVKVRRPNSYALRLFYACLETEKF